MIEKLEKVLEALLQISSHNRDTYKQFHQEMMMPLGLIVIGSLFLIVANPPINFRFSRFTSRGNIF